ncbi:MAG: hypothetical protein D6772_06170 [Bacteroidetes bacterium]|nr:MAG: hypothetical protein D6772_06170 [Bacteroidota bacterium]
MPVKILLVLGLCCWACRPAAPIFSTTPAPPADTTELETKPKVSTAAEPAVDTLDYDTTQWLELTDLDSTILLDIRYATNNNFVKKILYDCPRCFLRPSAARALAAAHQELRKQGLGLKLFDCYRPRKVQYQLWEIFPQPGYVANPDKGSIHNRGGAVDLTIVDTAGHELAMGTDFDFFGPQAHHTYTDLPDSVLANRHKLKTLMDRYGFSSIRKEWWHYNFRGARYPLADEMWNCPTR